MNAIIIINSIHSKNQNNSQLLLKIERYRISEKGQEGRNTVYMNVQCYLCHDRQVPPEYLHLSHCIGYSYIYCIFQ